MQKQAIVKQTILFRARVHYVGASRHFGRENFHYFKIQRITE